MKSNKVAHVMLAFNLPDDFNGDPFEALRLLLEYHDSKGRGQTRVGKTQKVLDEDFKQGADLLFSYLNDRLWDDPNMADRNVCGSVSVQEYRDGEWHNADCAEVLARIKGAS